jgi:hypothetical protein
MAKDLVERDTVPGDIIETPNGNRYLVLPEGKQAYIGNRNLGRSEGLVEVRPEGRCRLLTSIGLPKYA